MPIAAVTIHHPKKTLLVFLRAMSGVNCANVPYNPLKFGVRPKTVNPPKAGNRAGDAVRGRVAVSQVSLIGTVQRGPPFPQTLKQGLRGSEPHYIPSRSRTRRSASATCDGAVPPGTLRDSNAVATVVLSTSSSNSGENER